MSHSASNSTTSSPSTITGLRAITLASEMNPNLHGLVSSLSLSLSAVPFDSLYKFLVSLQLTGVYIMTDHLFNPATS
jgi:hypothetical protein